MKQASIGVLTILLVMVALPASLQAQRARYKPQTHQIELKVAGADWLAGYSSFESFAGMPVTASVVNGLRYQYAYSLQDAFRLGATYTPASWQATEPVAGFSAYSNDLTQTDIQLGYVRRYPTGPLQLYAGTDLRGGVTQMSETGEQSTGPYQADYSVVHYGLDGVAGVRTFLSPYLSFAVEANATYLRFQPQVDTPSELSYQFFGESAFSTGISAYLSLHFVELKKRCQCPKVRR